VGLGGQRGLQPIQRDLDAGHCLAIPVAGAHLFRRDVPCVRYRRHRSPDHDLLVRRLHRPGRLSASISRVQLQCLSLGPGSDRFRRIRMVSIPESFNLSAYANAGYLGRVLFAVTMGFAIRLALNNRNNSGLHSKPAGVEAHAGV
jgi:hypothetical protein